MCPLCSMSKQPLTKTFFLVISKASKERAEGGCQKKHFEMKRLLLVKI
jgi:hypothetical protein